MWVKGFRAFENGALPSEGWLSANIHPDRASWLRARAFSVQGLVLERDRVVGGCDVDEERGVSRQSVCQFSLQFLGEVVATLHCPATGDQHVHRDEAALSRCPRAHGVEAYPPALVTGQDSGNEFLFFWGQCPIQ